MSAVTTPGQYPDRPSLPNRLSTWFLCVVALVIAPLFPLFVEGAKNSWIVSPENILLTSAVLAVGYGFTSEGNFFRANYLITFLLAVGLDFRSTTSQIGPTGPAGSLGTFWEWVDTIQGWMGGHVVVEVLFVVTVLQAVERFNWHVILDRKFPDWLK